MELNRKIHRILTQKVPQAAVNHCFELWQARPFNFRITRARRTKLGDYKFIPSDRSHNISINNNLNPFAFLITYLHEVAHLLVYSEYGRKVKPHGKEWKQQFKNLLLPVFNDQVFPHDVLQALAGYLKNPKASSCSDHRLYRVLSLYDKVAGTYLSDLATGQSFIFSERKFKKEKLRRTRYVCQEVATGRKYLISKSAQVEPC
ncbi:MAG: SprT-like domain-containing protein [Fulvivirga sp.]|nr:SprT-like domain-containing protein [Fulvivirga sp.]